MPSLPANILGQIRELLGLGPDAPLSELTAPSPDALLRFTRRQLIDCAERLGLTGLTRLTKAGIAQRFQEALESFGLAMPSAPRPAAPPPAGGTLPKRFEQEVPDDTKPPPAHIPWSYGQDRVTAMVVDPELLYVYWEVTDEAITRARGALGPGGRDAWLDLRVYDVTGRLFDGTNAHRYVDQRVERSDRQWFFDVGRPTSTAVVEIGLQSHEGYFVRVARSGRADFPRREPAPPGGVEWLTVHAVSGDVGPTVAGTTPPPADAPAFEPQAAWDVRQTAARGDVGRFGREAWEQVVEQASDPIVRTLAWDGPVERLEWEAGPFDYPVASPIYVEERWAGPVTATSVDGRTHVIHGRWQVTIRGIGAHGERRVVARWELRRTWDTTARIDPAGGAAPGTSAAGVAGGSERRLGASELRLGGASELWQIGASERRVGGASELLTVGASERRLAGASERRLGGASETSAAYPTPPAPKR